MHKDEVIQDGINADQLVKNPLLEKILSGMEKKIIEDWSSSPAEDSENRERLYFRMEAVRKFRREITGCLNNYLVEMDKEKQGGKDE